MKKLIICMVCLCATMHTNSQLRDTTLSIHKIDASSLFQKAKHQKTAAWLLLIGGTGLFIAGESIIFNEGMQELSNGIGAAIGGIITLGYSYTEPAPVKHSAGARVMAYGGLGAMLGSIPLFISAHKNKRKANLILKDESVSFNPRLNVGHIAALGIKINL